MKRHSKALVRLIREQIGEPRNGVEVGVWTGENSATLLREFPHLVLWMVDRYKQLGPEEAAKDHRMAKMTQADFDVALSTAISNTMFAKARRVIMPVTSVEASKLHMDVLFDFCFLDASHDYPSVRIDLDHWYPRVRPGGLFCGHDYHNRNGFGVQRAVDEFAKRHGYTIQVRPGNVWWIKVKGDCVKRLDSPSRAYATINP